jgi:hypothetical protein
MRPLHGQSWVTDVRIGDLVSFRVKVESGRLTEEQNGVVVSACNFHPEAFLVENLDGQTFTVFPFEMTILSRID